MSPGAAGTAGGSFASAGTTGAGAMYAEELTLESISWSGHQLHVRWAVDRLSFTTTLWYGSVHFGVLETQFGHDAVARLAFHVAMFEINRGVSFRPSRLSIAPPWADLLTDALFDLWRTVVRKVWAQWRYEHDLPHYLGPGPTTPLHPARALPLVSAKPVEQSLWFCGGGKDSLLASHMLRTVGERYDALEYGHSTYGRMQPQMALIDRLVEGADTRRHTIYIYDTSTDLPVDRLSPYAGVRYVLAAETPASLFASLPIALTHGYRRLLLGHERSANVGNLYWSVTGEDVNHQWGKSLQAERLLGDYVRTHIAPEVHYCSILQPAADTLIFASLRHIADRVPLAHSCNVEKPWCLRCPKCAYVWICYKAWLPWEPVDVAFSGVNLLDVEENQRSYRQMLGLDQHTPFECIGQPDEVRLAFAMARARGLRGRAMAYLDQVGPLDLEEVASRYLAVADEHRMPPDLGRRVMTFFGERSLDARRFVERVLSLPAASRGSQPPRPTPPSASAPPRPRS